MSQNPDNSHPTLNSEDLQYISNIDAAHQNPTELIKYVNEVKNLEEQVKDEIDEEISKEIEKEVMSEMEKIRFIQDDSEDEDKWFPDYQNCKCCQGFVYNCKGEICSSLGQCYCKMKDDIEEDIEKNDLNNNDNSIQDNNKDVIVSN